MRIGVNGNPLSHPLTGIGQYTFHLLKHLISQHPDVEWVLYTHQPLVTSFFNNLKNVTINHYYSKPVNIIQKILYDFFIFSFGMKKILAQDRIDIFWSPTHMHPLIVPSHVKRLLSIHDLVYRKASHTMPFFRLIKEWIFFYPTLRTAHHVFVNSHTTQRDLHNTFSLNHEPTLVFPAYEKAIACTKPPIVPGKYILCVATKEPRKNLETLLSAYLQLPDAIKNNYTLVFCGGMGWKSNALMKKLNRAALRHRVVNFNYVDDTIRDNLYAHATLFAFPTYYEGFGMPVLEAMAHGLPLLLSDIPIMHELGADAALYCNPKSPADFCAALMQLLSHEDLLATYQQKSLERHADFNQWQTGAEQIWETMLAENRRSC